MSNKKEDHKVTLFKAMHSVWFDGVDESTLLDENVDKLTQAVYVKEILQAIKERDEAIHTVKELIKDAALKLCMSPQGVSMDAIKNNNKHVSAAYQKLSKAIEILSSFENNKK